MMTERYNPFDDDDEQDERQYRDEEYDFDDSVEDDYSYEDNDYEIDEYED